MSKLVLNCRVAVSLLVTKTSRNSVSRPPVASSDAEVFRPMIEMVEVPEAATLVKVEAGRPPMVMPLVIVLVVPAGFAEAAVMVGVDANVKSKSARAVDPAKLPSRTATTEMSESIFIIILLRSIVLGAPLFGARSGQRWIPPGVTKKDRKAEIS